MKIKIISSHVEIEFTRDELKHFVAQSSHALLSAERSSAKCDSFKWSFDLETAKHV